MLSKLRERHASDQSGFTLIELLVVILIIGILAAIALPAFLGQQKKGQDSDAKSNARNAVTQLESCFQDSQTYGGCESLTGSNLPVDTSSAADPAQGKVGVSGAGTDGYTIKAKSKSGTTFQIQKTASGTTRSCTATGTGGCNGSWTS